MDRLPNRSDVLEKVSPGPSTQQGTQASESFRYGPGEVQVGSIDASARCGKLTRREQQVIQMLTQGWSNKRIASELFVTQDTVKFHLKASYRKFGVRSRMEAVTVASRLGLVRFP